jgi:hypothetical protein
MNVYPFIEAEKAQQHNVKRACERLEVSRSAYYTHRAGPCDRDRQDAELSEQVLTKVRCCPQRVGALAKAVLTLEVGAES